MLVKKLGYALAIPCLLATSIANALTQTSSGILAASGGNSINLDNISGDLLIDSDVTLSGTLDNANLSFSNEITVTIADPGITVNGDTSFNTASIITLVVADPSIGITANSTQIQGTLIANNLNLSATNMINIGSSASIEIASTGSLSLATDIVTFAEIVNGATVSTSVDLTVSGSGAVLSNSFSGVITLPEDSATPLTLNITDSLGSINLQDTIIISAQSAVLELSALKITVTESRQGDVTNDIAGLGGIFITAPAAPLQQITIDGSVINTGELTDVDGIGVSGDVVVTGNVENIGTINNTVFGISIDRLGFFAPDFENETNINFNGPVIKGDVTNSGTINSIIHGISIQSATIQGQVSNTGDISASMENGIDIGGSVIEGGLVNTGSISGIEAISVNSIEYVAVAVFSGDDSGTPSILGVEARFNTNAGINGDITNNGTLTGTYDATVPPLLFQRDDFAALSLSFGAGVNGDIINSGTIEATGTGGAIAIGTGAADGIARIKLSASASPVTLEQAPATAVTGIIDNSGTISSASNFAIYVNNGSLAGVVNREAGVINSGNGIAIQAASLASVNVTDAPASRIGFVTNLGLINGSVDFGDGGGSFNTLGGRSGSVVGATALNIQLAPQATSNTISSINGDLSFAGNIDLAFQGITQESINSSVAGVLNVDGNADITGSSLSVSVSGDVFIAGGDEVAFLNANSLTSDLTSASDNSAVLDFTLSQRGNSLFATAVRTPIENIVSNENSGTNANIQAVATSVSTAAQQLDANSLARDSELANVVNSLSALATPEEVAAAVKTLEPEAVNSTSATAQIVDAMSSSVINQRLASLRGTGFSGAIAGDSLVATGFWTQYYDNRSKQDTIKGVDGFDADTFGLALGIDAALNNGMNIGLAFSYADTDVRSAGVENNRLDVESFRLTAYGSYNTPSYFVDAQLGFARNQYDSVRNVFNGTATGLRATSDHDGDQYTAQLRVGKPMVFDNGLLVTLKGSAQYSYLLEDSYSEKNAGNAGLSIDTDSVDAFILGAGIDVAYAITTANEITWVPELRLQVQYDFIGDEIEVDSNFVGVSAAAFTTQGANVEQTAINAGIGLRAFSQSNVSVALNADYLYKKDYKSVSGSLTVRYGF